MKYDNTVITNLVEISATTNIPPILTWLDKQTTVDDSHSGRYSYKKGSDRVSIDSDTFEVLLPGPHKFYFEKQEDAVWFVLKWS
jgi:hypothetical protein